MNSAWSVTHFATALDFIKHNFCLVYAVGGYLILRKKLTVFNILFGNEYSYKLVSIKCVLIVFVNKNML